MDVLNQKFNYISGGVTAVPGFKAAGVYAGIKTLEKREVALIFSNVPANAAGVFTRNKVQAAPLKVTQEHLADGKAQAVIINSGNANACNGERGLKDAKQMASCTAKALGLLETDVLVASTGVIGMPLPMETVLKGIKQAVADLKPEGGHEAAQAIMTTDLISKEVAISFELADKVVTIGAMAKGSGMIHPNMGTMLGFITTDANLDCETLTVALRRAVDKTFNMISVDGDTSTNDMVVMLANGISGLDEMTLWHSEFPVFQKGLELVCAELAKMIARDGEGATKLLEVRVINAPSEEDARKAAMAVVTSSLVKTAVFGEDANWGRILCAAGYSGAEFDPDQVDIFIGDEKVAADGGSISFSEERAKEILEQKDVVITVDLKIGAAEAIAWGCDLSYDYVRINGSYRT